MPRAAVKITKAEVERVVKGVIAGGVKLGRVEVEGGKITVYSGSEAANDSASPLDEWRRKNGEG